MSKHWVRCAFGNIYLFLDQKSSNTDFVKYCSSSNLPALSLCDNYKNLLMREAAKKKPCRVPKVDPELRLGILASADMRVDKEWSKIDLRDIDKFLGVTHIWGNATWPVGRQVDKLYIKGCKIPFRLSLPLLSTQFEFRVRASAR